MELTVWKESHDSETEKIGAEYLVNFQIDNPPQSQTFSRIFIDF